MTGRFEVPEHFGTHIDAPIHFVPGTASIDQVPASKFILPAFVLDVRQEVVENSDYVLTTDVIRRFEQDGEIAPNSVVLLLTGWDKHFASWERYRNVGKDNRMHFPGYSNDAASFLVNERHVAALGIDTLSIDAGIDEAYSVHNMALRQNLYLIENLTRLDQLPVRGAILFCGPLAIEGGSGSPARVLAMVL
jgi:kynurenine formamidase